MAHRVSERQAETPKGPRFGLPGTNSDVSCQPCTTQWAIDSGTRHTEASRVVLTRCDFDRALTLSDVTDHLRDGRAPGN
jgi:hypothetical protein